MTSKFNFGANEKQLKIRMKAVGNIKKITKAMKMVASSKMKAEVSRLMNGKDFGVHVVPTVLAMDPLAARKSPEIQSQYNDSKKLLVPITSDKGLCGGINSNMIRNLREIVAPNRDKWSIVCIGDKGTQALSRPFPDLLKMSINELAFPLNFYNVTSVAERILKSDVEFDRIVILYNEFLNVMQYKIREVEMMGFEEFKKHFLKLTRYNIMSPSKDYAIPYFYSLYISSKSFNC
jgi:F-type H+-transporting ATPase subunit gamma